MSDMSDLEELIDLYRVRDRYLEQLGREMNAVWTHHQKLVDEFSAAKESRGEVWDQIIAIIKGKIDEE
jgi:hypothetical protein